MSQIDSIFSQVKSCQIENMHNLTWIELKMWVIQLQIELNSKCQLETWLDDQSKQAIIQCDSSVIEWTDVTAILHWLKVWVTDLNEQSKNWRVRRENANIENNCSDAYYDENLKYFRQTMNIKSMIRFKMMFIHV